MEGGEGMKDWAAARERLVVGRWNWGRHVSSYVGRRWSGVGRDKKGKGTVRV
jgi:hypothetical protein